MSDGKNSDPQIIHVQGDHYQMGFQHGQQARTLLPAIHALIDMRLAEVEEAAPGESFERLLEDTIRVIQDEDQAILEFVRGQADGFGLEYRLLLRYNLVTYLSDVLQRQNVSAGGDTGHINEGCSTWAAAGSATVDGQPILAKNRDTNMLHLPVQTIVRAEPKRGYRYTYITSAGSPGVYVAGFNEAGLALVDTYVSSVDIGPGLPTYALSMYVLENHKTVHSAVAYLKPVPRQGRNNLLLADADGDMAVFEIGYENFGVQKSTSDYLVNTNHFSCAEMRSCFMDTNSDSAREDSYQRSTFLEKRLKEAYGRIDVAFAKEVMGSHSEGLSSVCKHPAEGQMSGTVSASIYLPAQRRMFFCHGFPCSQEYIEFDYND